ncbi:bombesin receptor subtype-3-like [Mytilus californianus]|uniref:bombesin receptor subtype-3-like n=1 Tax=Mytilus californianus TaxID=6549 RepID=UPI002245FAA5|nr:bombesin receptor subtype-3-like [Mytilus californianus]
MIKVNNSNETFFKTLQELNDAEAKQRLPTVIYLSILVTVGILGNSIILLVYGCRYKPTNFRCYILCLAVLDLTACCISIPSEIVDNAFPYMYYSEGFCKFSRFTGDVAKLGSAFVLTVMAAGRYRRICFPFSEEMSLKMAKMCCFFAISFSILLSWPTAIIQGQKVKKFPGNVTGYDCSTDDDVRNTKYPFIQATLLFVIFVLIFGILIYLYAKIIWELRDHFRMNRLLKIENGNNGKKRTKHTVTKIFLSITVAYVISYIPHLTLNAITTFIRGDIFPPSPIVLGTLPLLFRSYFVNNVVNIFVYYVGDARFRRHCKKLLQIVISIICRKKLHKELQIDSTEIMSLG